MIDASCLVWNINHLLLYYFARMLFIQENNSLSA